MSAAEGQEVACMTITTLNSIYTEILLKMKCSLIGFPLLPCYEALKTTSKLVVPDGTNTNFVLHSSSLDIIESVVWAL